MATPDLPPFRQVRTIRASGEAEFVTKDTAIQPGRHAFASQDDLNAYLVETLGGKAERGGVDGWLSRKGRYVRRSADGAKTVTFGDPILDAISSADGKLVIGGQTIDLLAGRPAGTSLRGAGVAETGRCLGCIGPEEDGDRP